MNLACLMPAWWQLPRTHPPPPAPQPRFTNKDFLALQGKCLSLKPQQLFLACSETVVGASAHCDFLPEFRPTVGQGSHICLGDRPERVWGPLCEDRLDASTPLPLRWEALHHRREEH